MNLTIKPLTLDLTPDYLEFFDNRAFSDNNPCGPCYCTGPSMDAATERQMVSEFVGDVKGTVRRYAVRLLAEEKIRGYLAFDDGKPIAWCNAGDMDDYVSWIPDFARQNACGKTMSVVCFAIAPEYRGMGVATALLDRVICDARADSYAAVEGYATVKQDRVYYDYHGPVRLYEKSGLVFRDFSPGTSLHLCEVTATWCGKSQEARIDGKIREHVKLTLQFVSGLKSRKTKSM